MAVALQAVALPALAGEASTELSAPAVERPPAVPAQMSDSVVDGVGVNVHLLYQDTSYSDFPAVQAALSELGVRHVRDSLGKARTDQYQKVNALAAAGIRTGLTLDKVTDMTAIGPRLDMIAVNMAGAVEAVEPPNEWNNHSDTWGPDLQAYQPELFRQVRSRPELDGVAVLGPSLARRTGHVEVGDLSAHLDAGNIHTYPNGFVPTRNMDLQIANQTVIAGAKPVVVTEAGYHNALHTTQQHYPVTEAVAGDYMPRLLLEYHRRGIRSYLYELFDLAPEPELTRRERHFGLIRADGTRKPAYDAVRNLLRLTADPGPAFAPQSLSYAATSPVAGLQQTLVQRRDGVFVLLLWRDVSMWDPARERLLTVEPAPVTVQLGDAAVVSTHRPSRSDQPVAVTPYVRTVDLSVGADVTALVIDPAVAPVTQPDAGTTDEDVPLVQSAPGLLGNDGAGEGGELRARLLDEPDHGTVALHPDGSYVYTPRPDYAGPDRFTYAAEDALSRGAEREVTLEVGAVNDAPAVQADRYLTDEDVQLETAAADGVLANDTDVDGDGLSAVVDTPPLHGDVVLRPDGGFRYTPSPGYEGPDAFGYLAVDAAGATTPGLVTLVVDTNVAPTATDLVFAVAEDDTLQVPAEAGLVASAADGDGDSLAATVVREPSLGAVTVAPDGSFSYVPHPDASGRDSFTYTVDDGLEVSAVATVALDVSAVNDPPVGAPDGYRTSEDMVLQSGAAGVLANDRDVDDDALVATLAVAPEHGTLVLATDGSFFYTPTSDWSGTDGFDYVVADAGGLGGPVHVTVQIDPVNDAPTAQGVDHATTEDVSLHVDASAGLLTTAHDVEGEALTAAVVAPPGLGTVTVAPDGSFDYLPRADAAGSDSFLYAVTDGSGASAVGTATVQVHPVNDLPVAGPDSYRTTEDVSVQASVGSVLGNDTDADGDALVTVLATPAEHGTVALGRDGSFTYTPALNWSGTDGFDYVVEDGNGGAAQARVTLVVDPANDAPVNVLPASLTMPRGTTATFSSAKGTLMAVGDVDQPGKVKVAVSVSNGTFTLKSRNGLYFLRGDGSADSYMVFRGSLSAVNAALHGSTFRPKAGFVGTAGLTLTSDDLSWTTTASDTDTLTITVK